MSILLVTWHHETFLVLTLGNKVVLYFSTEPVDYLLAQPRQC